MASIISASLNPSTLRDIAALQSELGFSGRSEVIRAGIRLLMQDLKEKRTLRGSIDAVLLVIHDDHHSEEVNRIRHDFVGIIKTQIHNHLKSHKCLETFVLSGEAAQVRKLVEAMQRSRRIDFAKLIVS